MNSHQTNRSTLPDANLFKQVGMILVIFFSMAVIWTFIQPYRSVYNLAKWTYEKDGFYQGEKFLVDYLEHDPTDEEGWNLLLMFRVLFNSPFLSEGKAYLDEQAFIHFLAKAEGPYPGALETWYVFYRNGLSSGIEKAGNLSDPIETVRLRAELYLKAERQEKALEMYQHLLRLSPQDHDAKQNILSLLVLKGADQEARALIASDADYERVANRKDLEKIYLKTKEYNKMLPYFFYNLSTHYSWIYLGTALFVGMAWLVFLLKMGRMETWKWKEKVFAILALSLGFCSAIITLLLLTLYNEAIGYHERQDIVYNLLYAILGIGLPEELLKLLFILPLLPFLIRSDNPLYILTTCSLIGLGFAIEENSQYYAGNAGVAVLSRFLTANFLHLILTGYCAYHLVQAIQENDSDGWMAFFFAFIKVTIIHGLYDFFLITPSLEEFTIVSIIIFIVSSQDYFSLFRSLSSPLHYQSRSLIRLFFIVLALVFGTSYCLTAAHSGLWLALQYTSFSLLNLAVIAYMFVRELQKVESG